MWPSWPSRGHGLHWQAVACGDLGITIWDWERMPAMRTGLGGRMKGKRHSVNEFRNTHAICEWLLSLCWTFSWVPTATGESLTVLSRRLVPSPWFCQPTPAPTAARAQAPRCSGWKMLPATRRALFRHAVHAAPCQGTGKPPNCSHPWEESGVQLFRMRQLPLVVAMLWGHGAPMAECKGGKLRDGWFGNLDQAAPEQPTSTSATVVGGSPAWWLASETPAAIRQGARARASEAHVGEKLAGSSRHVILERWEHSPSRNGVPAAPHLAQ